jgi:predicted nucleic acid-binding protein
MTSVQGLLDTSVLVDLWRGNSTALLWLRSFPPGSRLGLPVLVSMEFIDGVRNAAERKQATKFLEPYPVIHLAEADSVWAQKQHAQFKLSHNVGIIDALIAAPAFRLGVPIYTLNTKHFTPLPDVGAIKPTNLRHRQEG